MRHDPYAAMRRSRKLEFRSTFGRGVLRFQLTLYSSTDGLFSHFQGARHDREMAETQLWQQAMASLIRSGLFSKATTGEMNGLYTVVGVYRTTRIQHLAKYSDLGTCQRCREPGQASLPPGRIELKRPQKPVACFHGLRP